MVKQISHKTAGKLVAATGKICDYVNDGATPTEAAVKVATETNLLPSQIEMICRSYNAAAVNEARRDGGTFVEKYAAVEKVNPADVLDKLFPSKVKAANDSLVAEVYRPQASRRVKVAKEKAKPQYARPECDCGCGERPTYCKFAGMSRYKRASLLRDELQEIRGQVRRIRTDMVSKVAKVADSLTASQARDINYLLSVRKIAEDLYGEPGRLLVDRAVAKKTPGFLQKKYAADLETFPGRQVKLAYDRNFPVIKAVREAINALEKFSNASKSYIAHGVRIRRKLAELTTDESQYADEAAIMPPGVSGKDIWNENWDKVSAVLPALVGAGALQLWRDEHGGGSDSSKDKKDKLVEMRLKLNDPQHNMELRRIESEAMLNKMLEDDSVISSYPPDQIAKAFEELETSVPGLIENQLLLRANLRRQLQGNLTPMEAASVVDAERQLIGMPEDRLKYLENQPK